MEYRNKVTGISIHTDCILQGGDWVLVSDDTGTSVVPDYDDLSVSELKQLLSEKGISPPPKAKKSELLRLLQGEEV